MATLDDVLAAIAQNLGQLNARMREAGDGATETIHGFYREARRLVRAFDDRKGFGLRPISVSLTVNIVNGTISAANTYKVPDNEDFLVSEMRGYLAFDDWSAEVVGDTFLDNSNNGNISPRDRAYIKSSNCKISLTNNDSKLPITDGTTDLVLSSILGELGAQPMRYGGEGRPALIVPHGQTLKMLATLAKSAAKYAGATTDYGVILSGVMLSRGASGRG